jgi:hypothetical protein
LQLDSNFSQSATGVIEVTGGQALQRSSTLTIAAGSLQGTGTVLGSVQMTGGSIRPGASPGVLNINGNLQLSPASSLVIDIGGVTVGSLYDRLVVSGTASLARTGTRR